MISLLKHLIKDFFFQNTFPDPSLIVEEEAMNEEPMDETAISVENTSKYSISILRNKRFAFNKTFQQNESI